MIGGADLQAVLVRFLAPYLKHHTLAPQLRQVCEYLRVCRTAVLGGLRLSCDHCGAEPPQYHACRDRHCPKCQRRASEAWCKKQTQAVLPVTYYHVVFTLPHLLNPWVQCYPQVIYALLFQSVWATLSAFAANPKHLGGQLGMTAVLHTWGQTLAQLSDSRRGVDRRGRLVHRKGKLSVSQTCLVAAVSGPHGQRLTCGLPTRLTAPLHPLGRGRCSARSADVHRLSGLPQALR